jgi:hypothetical protein
VLELLFGFVQLLELFIVAGKVEYGREVVLVNNQCLEVALER